MSNEHDIETMLQQMPLKKPSPSLDARVMDVFAAGGGGGGAPPPPPPPPPPPHHPRPAPPPPQRRSSWRSACRRI
jgi:hypothetical protein